MVESRARARACAARAMRGPHVVLVGTTRRVPSRLGPDAGPEESLGARARRRATRATRRVARAVWAPPRSRARSNPPRSRASPGAVGRHPRGDARRAPRRRRRAHPPSGLFSRARPPRGTHVFDARPERARRASRGARGHQLRRHRRCRAPARARDDVRWAHDVVSARGFDDPEAIPRPRRRRTRPRPTRSETRSPSNGSSATPARRRTLLPLLRSSHPPARRRNQRPEQRRHSDESRRERRRRPVRDGRSPRRFVSSSSEVEPRRGGARAVRRRRRRSHHPRRPSRGARRSASPRRSSHRRVGLSRGRAGPSGDLPFAFEGGTPGDDFGAGSSGVETADGPAEVGRTIVVATRANATTVETMETARRVAEGVSMFAPGTTKSRRRVAEDGQSRKRRREGGRRRRRVRGGEKASEGEGEAGEGEGRRRREDETVGRREKTPQGVLRRDNIGPQ